MTVARLSQLPVEVLRTDTGVKARLSQLPVEVLRTQLIYAQLGQLPVEVVRANAPAIWTGAIAESFALSDSWDAVAAAGFIAAPWADSFTLSDAYVAGLSSGVAWADSLTLSDAYDAAVGHTVLGDWGDSFALVDAYDAEEIEPPVTLCPGLPPGWVMTRVLETVPDPNAGTMAGGPGFVRWTYVTTDESGEYVCASGSDTDCCSQAHAMAQARTQRRPYDEAS